MKYYRILISTLFLLLIAGFFVNASGQNTPLTEINRSYYNGNLTAGEAVTMHLQHLTDHNHGDDEFIKCATPLFSMIDKMDEMLTPRQQQMMAEIFPSTGPATMSETFISESGKFEIHYETSGANAVPLFDENNNSVPDYVEWVAEASDSSYRHEVIRLGYTDPIPDGLNYDVFVADLSGFGAYGLTNNSTSGAVSCATSSPATCIYIENDFAGYPENTDPGGDTLGAVKVTMAHEFKHAIQYVQNRWSGDSDLYAEMDATLYEEVVYDEVNDYYNYIFGFGTGLFDSALNAFTSNGSSCFATSSLSGCYEDITWALYFHERFGEFFWPNTWEYILADPNLTLFAAITNQLAIEGVSFEEAVLESYMWHMVTGQDYSNFLYGFDEQAFYPGPLLTQQFDSLQTDLSAPFTMNRFGTRYFGIDPVMPVSGNLLLNYRVSSSLMAIGILFYYENGNIDSRMITNPSPNRLVELQTTVQWEDLDKIGVVASNLNQNGIETFEFNVTNLKLDLAQNYPNPFNPSTTIPVILPREQQVTLQVFSSTGQLVRTVYEGTLGRGMNNIVFNSRELASGVYFYRLISEEGTLVNKMTIIK